MGLGKTPLSNPVLGAPAAVHVHDYRTWRWKPSVEESVKAATNVICSASRATDSAFGRPCRNARAISTGPQGGEGAFRARVTSSL